MCPDCVKSVKKIQVNTCSVCGVGLEFEYEIETGDKYRCGDCRLNPPPFEEAMFALRYDGSVRSLVHSLKYNSERSVAPVLAQLGEDRLVPFISRWPEAVVIPVPLARSKLFSRGYNPSYLLARSLCEKSGAKVTEGALRRTRPTKPQFNLNRKERLKNVRGAFAVHNPSAIKGKTVIVFDDIYTTGATVIECCKVINREKPEKVFVVTLCRA